MRKYIVSDIHGNGNFYYSLMTYLENVSKNDDVTLYINGDLIDRGKQSAEILLDVMKRINDNNSSFKIVYLAGNHELEMFRIFRRRKKGLHVRSNNLWYLNGGRITDKSLEELLKTKEKILELVDFISNLKLYHKFEEKIDGKEIVLVHACCPVYAKDECDLKISDDIDNLDYLVWTRKNDPYFPFRCRIGDKKYFTIFGHTVNNFPFGYYYDEEENALNIDGGCAYYVTGSLEYDHYPLVEIKEDELRILTFNNNNEIIYGNYFRNYRSIPFSEEELLEENRLLKSKTRMLIK